MSRDTLPAPSIASCSAMLHRQTATHIVRVEAALFHVPPDAFENSPPFLFSFSSYLSKGVAISKMLPPLQRGTAPVPSGCISKQDEVSAGESQLHCVLFLTDEKIERQRHRAGVVEHKRLARWTYMITIFQIA